MKLHCTYSDHLHDFENIGIKIICNDKTLEKIQFELDILMTHALKLNFWFYLPGLDIITSGSSGLGHFGNGVLTAPFGPKLGQNNSSLWSYTK